MTVTGRPGRIFVWVSPIDVPESTGTYQVYVDLWWIVDAHARIALYGGWSPQGNAHKQIVDRMLPNTPGGVDVVQLPMVVLPHRCEK